MELLNATKMQAGYTMGMRPDGRQLLVVAVKGTFQFPAADEEAALAEEQVPLIEADEFTGEPGFSATLYESDYPPYKPCCDVLLNGSAYAPGGEPAQKVTVSLRLGAVQKSFRVVGDRVWKRGVMGPRATEPEPFVSMPISYDNAFGGVDETDESSERHSAFRPNHVGRGYHTRPYHASIDSRPLPNTEELDRPVVEPNGKYRPMSFGTIARSWSPRLEYAGTYDEDWVENVFPFLPKDFDERYYQAAPVDQQLDHLVGGEEVELVNLTPEGHTSFRLPEVKVPVEFCPLDGESVTVDAPCDALLIEPDHGRFMLVWRASIPLKRDIFEIPMGIVGRMPRGWYRARELGKTYYRNLAELVAGQSG